MYLVINKCVTAVKVSNFSGYYLRNRSTLDIGVLGYIGIVQRKEHSPEVLSVPPGTPVYKTLTKTYLRRDVKKFTLYSTTRPNPVAERSKAWFCGRSLAGIVGLFNLLII